MHRNTIAGVIGLAGLCLAPGAQARVATSSDVYVERRDPARERRLEPASRLSPGDRVVTIVTWRRDQAGRAFTITNPLPRHVSYQDSARDDQEVSVDGGRTWGALDALRIGGRVATPEDVTHIRWRIAGPQAAQRSGRIAFSGIVR